METTKKMQSYTKPLTYVLVKPAGPDCNLACDYCFYYKKQEDFEGDRHRMSPEIQENMIRQAMEQSGRSMGFGWQGGEPTLMGLDFYKRSIELQQHFGEKFNSRTRGGGKLVSNGLQTNGILLNTQWSEFLRDNHFLVGLSIDGPEHVHNAYRKFPNSKGSHAIVEEKARMLLQTGVEVNALSVLNDYSVKFPDETYQYLKELGFTYMQFIPVVETNPFNLKEAAPFSVTPEAYGDYLCRLFDLWKADFSDGLPTTSVRLFDSLVQRYMGMPSADCVTQKECGGYVVVEHTGDVYSCDFFVEDAWHLGNIEDKRLIDMLNSKRQKLFGEMKKKLPKKCITCPWLQLCRGGCTKDRLRDPSDKKLNHFCGAYKKFYSYADKDLRTIAAAVIQYRRNQQNPRNS